MRELFDMDLKNYDPDIKHFVRPSVRGIVIQNGKIAMVHVRKYNGYKFPGGGIDPGEEQLETLIREVREESGLIVIQESIREYGFVHRVEFHEEYGDVFDQMNYYYLCETREQIVKQDLDSYEQEAGFELQITEPEQAIEANWALAKDLDHPLELRKEMEREARVLELLMTEGHFSARAQ